MGAAAQLREIDSGNAATLLRVCNIIGGLLAFGIAGCWHVYAILWCVGYGPEPGIDLESGTVDCTVADCSDMQTTDDGLYIVDLQDAANVCMPFFPRLSSAIVALYIVCVRAPQYVLGE
jgi:hypothetical protein